MFIFPKNNNKKRYKTNTNIFFLFFGFDED